MSLSPELLSATILLSVLAGVAAGGMLLRERAELPWAAGWAFALTAGICLSSGGTHPAVQPIGHLAGSLHPALFAAGACVYARRPILRPLLVIGLAAGTTRALLVLAGREEWSLVLGALVNPALLLYAALLVHRHVVRAGEPFVHQLLPAGFVFFAGLAGLDPLYRLGLGDVQSLWSVWIPFGVLFAACQVFATMERSGRERAGALRDLGDNERRFVEISEGAYDLVFEFDYDARVVYASAGGETALGFHPGEVLGREAWDLVHPEDAACLARQIARLRDEPRIAIPPVRVQHANGGWRWLEANLRRYHLEDGDERTLVVCRDVTERRQAEEAFESARARLQAVLSSLGELRIVTFDEDGRIQNIYGPPPAPREEAYGIPRSDAAGASVRDFLPESAAEAVVDAIRRVFKTGEPGLLTHRVQLPNGSFAFRGAIHPLRGRDGAVEGALALAEDVTEELARGEQQRQQAERSERGRRQQSLALLAGGLAHQFNNLLMAIGGNADLALERLAADAPGRELLIEIGEASQTASRLTAQLLAYLGQTAAPVEPLDVASLLAAAEPSLRERLPANVRLEVRPEPVGSVRGDRAALLRALSQLVDRAADALQGGEGGIVLRSGELRLDRERLERSLNADELSEGDYALLEVRDDGPPIPTDQLERLFDPFFAGGPGERGIGLAEVLGIMRGHRGTIEVESGARGSAIRLLIPRLSS